MTLEGVSGVAPQDQTGLGQRLQPGLDLVIQLVDLARPAVDRLINAGRSGLFQFYRELVCLAHVQFPDVV
ncbi:hypothetical protein D3C79_1108300 [compost metagenome]